jgi:DNA invertase Pin-like site-specific DNA recombinase
MNNLISRRFFIYARKSLRSEDRQVRSINDQLAELRSLAGRDGLDVVQEFTESHTAKRPGRPIFEQMLKRIEQGEADSILAWHPDRLARNSIDGGRIVYMLDTGQLKDLRFPTFPFDPSPAGKYLLALMFCQSKHFSDSLAENIKRGKRQKLLEGIWPQLPPLGYLNDKTTRTIVPDPVRAPLIKKTFSLYAKGNLTIDRLKLIMTDAGLLARNGVPLSRSQFHRTLQNPIYCGTIEFAGETYEGKHVPIISRKLFDTCQAVRTRMRRCRTGPLKPYLYRGVFRCGECGSCITCESHKGYTYLRCIKRNGPCSQQCVREETIPPQIADAVRRMALPPQCADAIIAEFDTLQRKETSTWNQQIAEVQIKLAALEEKLQRLVNAYVDGDVPLTEYRKAKKRLFDTKQKQTETLVCMQKNPQQPFEPAKRFIRGSVEARNVAESEDITRTRDFLQKHCSNLTLRNGNVNAFYRGAWKIVVGQGRFGNPLDAATPANTRVGNVLCPVVPMRKPSDGVRMLFDGVYNFFKDNPVWE